MRFIRPRPVLSVLLVAAVLLLGGTGWLLGSNSGLRWLGDAAQSRSGGMLEIGGIEGALIDRFDIRHLTLRGEGWRLELADLHVHWRPARLLRGELNVVTLSVRAADLLTLPGDKPFVLPATLRLPLTVDVQRWQVDTLRLSSREQGPPDLAVDDLRASYRADRDTHHLRDLQARIASAAVSGEVRIAQDAPYPLQASFTVHGELPLPGKLLDVDGRAELGGDLQRLELNVAAAGAGAQLNATLQWLPAEASPLAHARIGFSRIDARWLAQGAPLTVLSGAVELHGTAPGVLEGTAQMSNAKAAALDHAGLPLTTARTRLRLAQGRLQLRELELHLLHDGLLQGEAEWDSQRQRGRANLHVRALDPTLLDGRAPKLGLQGTVVLDADAARQQARLSLHDETWRFEGELLKQGPLVDVRQFSLARGDTVLDGSGQLRLEGQHPFQLDTRLRHLDLAESLPTPTTALNAGLAIRGTLLPEPSGLLDFVFFDSRFGGHVFDGDGRLRVLPGRRAKGTLNARLGDNRLDVDLAYGTTDDRLRLTFNAPRLEQVGSGLAGRLDGLIELHGTPAEPVASFSLTAERLELPSGIGVEELAAGGVLDTEHINLHLAAAAVRHGVLAIPRARLDLDGRIDRHTIEAEASVARNEQALGNVSLAASGGWEHTAQAWRWQGMLDGLNTQGVLPLQLQTAAPLVVAPDGITLGAVQLATAGGHIHLHETNWSPLGWHSAGSFGGIGVRAIEETVTPELVQSLDTLRFGGDWELGALPEWQGSINVQRESGDWAVNAGSTQSLGLNKLHLALRAAAGALTLQLDVGGDRLGEFSLQANLPFRTEQGMPVVDPDAPLSGRLKLHTADLGWLGPMLDGNLQSGGRLQVDAELFGTRDMPRLQGGAQGRALRLALLDQGVSLEQGELAVRFVPDAVYIDRLDFVAPYLALPDDPLLSEYRLTRQAGRLSVAGNILLTDEMGQLDVVAEGLPLAQRPDRWLLVSGKAGAVYASKTLTVSGNATADAGLIGQVPNDRPRLSDDVRLVGQAPVKKSDFSRAVAFNLDLGRHFYVNAMGLESRLSGELAVYGAAGEALQASGSIATEQGVLMVYGQRLEVERGLVNFQGPLDDPGLNLLALRKGLSVEAGVEVSGTARHPVTRLISTPNVPDAEKLSWIVLGRVPDSGGIDTSLLLAAAGNVIGGSTTGQVGRAIGVDELSLHQRESGDPLQNQVVTVGKRLSSRAYLSYEQGLADPGGLTKFTYTLTPRITLVTRTGVEDAIDLFYSFRFY